jgi:uroporphyrinogen-III synthase
MTGGEQERLAGWRVLVPHGGDWGDRVTRLLAAHGAQAVVVPLIEFAPPADVAPLDAALRGLTEGTYDWVTITSGTTVTALAGRAAGIIAPTSPAAGNPGTALAAFLGRSRVAAVGPGTARVLERYGITPDLVPSGERSARGLVAEFPPPPAGTDPAAVVGRGRVLVPHSDLADPTVVDGLRSIGWEVDDVVAYRTVSGPQPSEELREDMRAGVFKAVLLSSASTVTNMVELVGPPPPPTVVCCIGPRTERAAREAGLDVRVVPPSASAEELVEALVRYVEAQEEEQ